MSKSELEVPASLASPANQATELAPLAGLAASHQSARDANGRFLTGNNGGGRPKGARNRLSEQLLSAIVDDFVAHGPKAIAQIREVDPVAYLKIVSSLVPRELIVAREQEPEFDYADLSYEEKASILETEQKRANFRTALKHVRSE